MRDDRSALSVVWRNDTELLVLVILLDEVDDGMYLLSILQSAGISLRRRSGYTKTCTFQLDPADFSSPLRTSMNLTQLFAVILCSDFSFES